MRAIKTPIAILMIAITITATISISSGQEISGLGQGQKSIVFENQKNEMISNNNYFPEAVKNSKENPYQSGSKDFICGSSTVSDIDGNIYNTVQIGNQCWMSENLKTTKYRDGTPIDYPGDDAVEWESNTNGAYAWYGNDIYWKDFYGALYNWYAVANQKGLCPQGWNEPTHSEWSELLSYVWSINSQAVGSQLKSCRQINSPLGMDCNTDDHPRWNEHQWIYGTDNYGLGGLPAGARNYDFGADFWGLGLYSTWWSSTELDEDWAWIFYLELEWEGVFIYDDHKNYGFSVRCIRDETGSAYIPEINTTSVRNITSQSALSGGDVTYDGGSAVTQKGIVWSQTENPSINSYEGITIDGSGEGWFESNLTGLDDETVYYLRAYAINEIGTAYGEQESFSTLPTIWDAPTNTDYNTSEAAIVHRTGDIDNLGFAWPPGFDPFSGESTPGHYFPFYPEPNDPDGTDRIMVISGFIYGSGDDTDGYTWTTSRPDNIPVAINMNFDLMGTIVNDVVIQMFVDDFQAGLFGSNYFQVLINGVRIPILEDVINSLNQTGPIGKLITVQIPVVFNYLFSTGNVSIFIDDPINNVGDGFAIDFVRILINPLEFTHTGTITGTVLDEDELPVVGATVTAAGMLSDITDDNGFYELLNVPAGHIFISASKIGYNTATTVVDLVSGDWIVQDFELTLAGIPEELQLSDLTIESTTDTCFNATQSIIIAGDGFNVVFQNGSNTEIISGNKILLKDITVTETGAHLILRITSDNTYCNNQKSMLKAEELMQNELSMIFEDGSNNTFFKVYPNPTTGLLTLELNDATDTSTIKVEIFNMMGERVMKTEMPQMKQYLFDLSARQRGVYLIKIMHGKEVGVEKIVIQ